MKDQINKTMEKAVAEGVFPSASLLVAKGGEVLHNRQYGDAREGTCFDIASLTKPVCTATLVMMLVEEGLLKTTDNVYQWLGGARLPEHKLMTVQDLLNHTSGLPAWQPYYRELPLDLVGTESGKHFILDSCFREPPVNPPGEKVLYSDIGYIILGEIIEQAAGAPLGVLFSNRIAKPLGLGDTFFVKLLGKPVEQTSKRTFASADQHVPTPKHGLPAERKARKEGEHRRFAPTEDCPWRERVIHGEVHDQNTFALGGVAGHSGLFSTASDLHRFILEFVSCYNGKSKWIPKSAVRCFIDFDDEKTQKLISKRPMGDNIYLGGWNTPSPRNPSCGTHFSKETIGHLGYTGCSFWIDLKKDYWVILLSNRIHPSTTNERIKAFRPRIHDLVYDTLFKK